MTTFDDTRTAMRTIATRTVELMDEEGEYAKFYGTNTSLPASQPKETEIGIGDFRMSFSLRATAALVVRVTPERRDVTGCPSLMEWDLLSQWEEATEEIAAFLVRAVSD